MTLILAKSSSDPKFSSVSVYVRIPFHDFYAGRKFLFFGNTNFTRPRLQSPNVCMCVRSPKCSVSSQARNYAIAQ